MKKLYLLAMLALASTGISAQTLLNEDFETSSTETFSTPVAKTEGWTTVNSYTGTAKQDYNWVNYYSSSSSGAITGGGKHCATCDAPTYATTGTDGAGPREEVLLTPELDLNNTYQLTFTWVVSPMAFYDASRYDIQVRVVEDGNLDKATTIFSIQDKDILQETTGTTSITGWSAYTSKINLSQWKGKKVKVAFVYKMLTAYANSAYIDDVKVEQHDYPTGPVAQLNTERYNFGEVYMGEKFYTEAIKLTNVGEKGLKIESVELPTGVAINIDPTTVNLGVNESTQFQFSYTASLTSPASAKATLHTNGGDVSVDLSATKLSVPDGMTEETFDAYFPPAGWTNDGWSAASKAIEGDVSAYSGVNLNDTYLTSPRLDLTKGGSLIFTYYNQFDSEDGSTYQENDITVDLSTDGGKTWKTMWTFDYDNDAVQNVLVKDTVTFDASTDNCFVRFHNTAVEYDSESGAGEGANFYLDRVFLPNVYGQDGVPGAATLVTPKDSVTSIYPYDVKLEWGPAQFATGYKLYVGTASDAYDVVNGTDLGNTLTYTIAKADYEKMYFWKVVPYNAQGDATETAVWHFTTQKDATVSTYPYSEDFTGVKTIPEGWYSWNNEYDPTETTAYNNRLWETNKSYGNDAPCLSSMWLSKGNESWVVTPDFKLPADADKLQISFDWTDQHPSNTQKDATGLKTKNNIEPNNGYMDLAFEINAGDGWKKLSHISQDMEATHYWINEKVDLSEYAGKTVQFRWHHYSYSASEHGCAIDNVVVEAVSAYKATFNKDGWNAGKVNYNMAVNSGDVFTIINKGYNTLKITDVKFGTTNFTTSLATGTSIAPNEGTTFNVQFNAGTTNNDVTDKMTVSFEGGYSVEFPVDGTALAEDIFYYAFEDNKLDLQWISDFQLIDVDKAATVPFTCYGTECPESGGVYAFTAAYERPEHNNVAPISGDGFIIPGSPLSEDVKGDNWMVSKHFTIKEGATFDFYCRNWESTQSILPSAKHKVQVLVNETSRTDRDSFTALLTEEIPYLDGKEWQHYTVDLSAYVGKDIYVAVRDYNEQYALAAFYDDFTFTHVALAADGIQSISSEIADNAAVSVYSMNGMQVAQGTGINTLRSLQKGMYVVKVQDGNQTKALRIVRK